MGSGSLFRSVGVTSLKSRFLHQPYEVWITKDNYGGKVGSTYLFDFWLVRTRLRRTSGLAVEILCH